MKLKHDHNIDNKIVQSWSVMAENSWQNIYAYSLYQLVFGRNPNILSVLNYWLSALQVTATNEIMKNPINSLHRARQPFSNVESSDKIRKALHIHQIIVYLFTKYTMRLDNQEWRALDFVIVQDSPVTFIRHGEIFMRAHKCRL